MLSKNLPAVKVAAIPDELKDQPQWIVWSYRQRGGKLEKVPYNTSGQRDDVTLPGPRANLQDALAYAAKAKHSGIGYVLERDGPYTVLDFDNCVDSAGTITKNCVSSWLSQLGSYSEVSPSGTGIKVWIKASKPGTHSKNTKLRAELYDRDRYLTVTGHQYGTYSTIESRQTELNTLYAQLFPEVPTTSLSSPYSPTHSVFVVEAPAILAAIRKSSMGKEFTALYDDGDISRYNEDASKADYRLCWMLAFYTRDKGTINYIVQESALYRDKWQRADYRERTIQAALDNQTERWQPKTPPQKEVIYHIEKENTTMPEQTDKTMLDRRLNREIAPPMIIDKKLPIGLTLVVGEGKIGKGWLLLQESESIIKRGGKVLYYALEEAATLIDQRIIDKLKWDDATLDRFILKTQLAELGPVAYQELESRIIATKATTVIIDTYSRVHPEGAKMNDYIHMSKALQPLSAIGRRNQCAVIVTLHTVKRVTGNPVADIMGSTALSGTADAIWGLYREQDYCVLKIIGKETTADDVALRFNKLTCGWDVLGEVNQVQNTISKGSESKVIVALQELGRCGKCADIARQAKIDQSNCNRVLRRLIEKKTVSQPEPAGKYYLESDGTTTDN